MKTIIVGASTNTSRYAYLAAEMLLEYNHEIVLLGIKKGTVLGHEILDIRSKPAIADVHTITLYIGPAHQQEWYTYLLKLQPKRVIFNPGTESPTFAQMAVDAGAEVLNACTLVMLRTNQY